jgi:hypothetical protein
VPDGLSQHQLDVLLEAALAAPSMHNTQPWRFEVDTAAIDVFVDRSRALPAEDPTGRALRIAAGAAVFNLRCAAAWLGLGSWYGLAPSPDEPDLAARLVLTPVDSPDRELAKLYPQIARRHTSREPSRHAGLPSEVRITLLRAAASEGGVLTWLPEPAVQEILTTGASALLRGWANSARTAERAKWIGPGRSDDGIEAAALGPRPAVYPAPVRDLGAGLPGRGRARKAFEADPALAVLSSEGDGPVDQLVVGMALQRVLLTATAVGIRASFLNQSLEYDESRAATQRLTGKPGFAQMIIRFTDTPATVATSRRQVADVVRVRPGSMNPARRA